MSHRAGRRPKRLLAIATAAGAVVAACSIVVDTSDLASGRSDGAAPDSSAIPDAGDLTGGDAETDAADRTDAASADAASCSVSFCDSFERAANNLLGDWSRVVTTPGASVSIDEARALTGRSSLRVTIPTSSADDGRGALFRAFVGSYTRVRLRFSLFFALAPLRQMHVAGAQFRTGSSSTPVFFLLNAGTIRVAVQNHQTGAYEEEVVANATPGRWLTFALEVTPGSRPRVVVTLDGAKVVDRTFDIAVDALREVGVGTSYARTGPAVEAWYDDVAVEVVP